MSIAECAQLLLVDYQEKLMPAIHEGSAVLKTATTLAHAAHLLGVPIWASTQNAAKLGPNAATLMQAAQQPRVFDKMRFSAVSPALLEALRGPDTGATGHGAKAQPVGNARSLPKHLRKPQAPAAPTPVRDTVVLAGCEAHVCLLQTALELMDEEFDVWVVTDACGSRRVHDRDAAFDRMAANGIELVTMEMFLFECLDSCTHPQFKNVLTCIK